MIELPPPQLVPSILGAIKGSTGDRGLNESQQHTLEQVAHGLLKLDIDVAELPALNPAQAAAAIADPVMRKQAVQIMIAIEMLEPMVDMSGNQVPNDLVTVDQADRIASYAKEFDIEVDQLETFRHRANGQMKLMVVDLFARTPILEGMIDEVKDHGVATVIRNVLATRGYKADPEISQRYQRLEDLPDGAWGKQVWKMYQVNGWPLPGELHGVPEATARHDWVHVISGYPPTPVGELQVNGFMHSTSDNPQSFGGIVLALSLYGLGGVTAPIGFTSRGGGVDRDDIGALFSESIKRGLASGTDFLFGMEHWENAALPVEQIREQYNVPSKEIDIGEGDPGTA